MKLTKHLLEGESISQQPSNNKGGKFPSSLPDTIVIHFTGGRSAQSSANWQCDPKAKASAHVVVGQKGEIIQLVPFDTIAWHAGRSSWEGRSGLNQYSIGIEIDNAGRLEKQGDQYVSWFKKPYKPDEVFEGVHRNETVLSY